MHAGCPYLDSKADLALEGINYGVLRGGKVCVCGGGGVIDFTVTE